MKVIIDTNVWVSFMLGSHVTDMRRALLSTQVTVCVCEELIRELTDVAARPKIQKYIKPQDIDQTIMLMQRYCSLVHLREMAASNVRDKDDLFLLSLAKVVDAEYIITGDKDLLVLGSFGNAKIITPAEAFRVVPF